MLNCNLFFELKQEIDLSHLITLVADILFESNTDCPAMNETLDSTLSLLPMLEKGLDVNSKSILKL